VPKVARGARFSKGVSVADFPSFSEVRTRLNGLKGLITRLGDAPPEHKWKSFPKCPFCGAKDCAGVFSKSGADFFKCQHTSCNTGGRVVTEIGYVGMREGLAEENARGEKGPSPAYRRLLELAGLYQEPTATGASLTHPVTGASPLPDEGTEEDEEIIQQCIEVIRMERRASVSVFQRRLRLGYTRAARIMDEIEARGLVGPAKGAEPRDILFDLRHDEIPNPVLPPELDLPPQGGALPPGPAGCDGPAGPVEGDNVGVIENVSGDAGETRVPTADDQRRNTPAPVITHGAGPAQSPPPASPVPPAPPAAAGENLAPKFRRPEESAKPEEKPELPPGLTVLREFYRRLQPTDCELRAVLPDGEPVPDPISKTVLGRIEFTPVSLQTRRGLTPETCAALGFRANPRSNEALLQELEATHDWEERSASGLWLEADRKRKLGRRPNTQYCGKGQVGRKPAAEAKKPDDKWQWGWSQPVLIPYFDATGELVKLRPHKGGASSGTQAGSERIYIPRCPDAVQDTVENFFTVIICEGEFKAAALWQEIGAGAELNYGDKARPVGVCALPGISFVKNHAYRADLEEWLQAVGCRRVIVAFDDEDKSGKPLAQRFDAKKYERYLAQDLATKLHLTGLVANWPPEWRNAKGKADWDGALVKLLTA